MWYLLSAWDFQEWLQPWAAGEEPVVEAAGPVVEAVGPVVEAAGLVVEAEQPVVEARGSAAREFRGTRPRHLWTRHARP